MIQFAGKLGLGSAQWGMHYGVSNSTGRTQHAEIGRLLKKAREVGIGFIDTASLYGGAEQALGMHSLDGLKIVTKTPRFAKSRVTEADAKQLVDTFQRSIEFLRVESVNGLLVHHADDVLVPGSDYLIEALTDLKNRGFAKRIGISIYNSNEIEKICDRLRPDIVQLPLNVIDQRLLKDGSLEFLHRKGIEVHVRSVFLQGLLLMPIEGIPDYFRPWRHILKDWHEACALQGVSKLQAALNFTLNLNMVDCVVVGIENLKQFKEILGVLDFDNCFDYEDLGSDDVGLVNPVNWRL